MSHRFVLASGSSSRRAMLAQAGVEFEVTLARLDEQALRESLSGEGVSPRDQADALAEGKALKVSAKMPDALVLGADQICEIGGEVYGKPADPAALRDQLRRMSGNRHKLHSAAVLAQEGRPVWRSLATVTLTVRPLSDAFIEAYVERNWERLQHVAGGYEIEGEGVRLFSAIQGDYFAILGLPLTPLLNHLAQIGLVET